MTSETDLSDARYLLQDHNYDITKALASTDSLFSATSASNIPSSPNALRSSVENLSFLPLQPPLSDDDYNFALGESEGIADLFDEFRNVC